MHTVLTEAQKLQALSDRFYSHLPWVPESGHYYTTARADLELYRIAKIEDGKVFTEYCTNPGQLSEWDEAGFTTGGFGPCRVWVSDYILEKM